MHSGNLEVHPKRPIMIGSRGLRALLITSTLYLALRAIRLVQTYTTVGVTLVYTILAALFTKLLGPTHNAELDM